MWSRGTYTGLVWVPAVHLQDERWSMLFLFWDEIVQFCALRGCSCGSRGFLEDRIMDIVAGHLTQSLAYRFSVQVLLQPRAVLTCMVHQ